MIGERFKSNTNGWASVILYKNSKEVTVQFDSGEIITTELACLRKGLFTSIPRITTFDIFYERSLQKFGNKFKYDFVFTTTNKIEEITCLECGIVFKKKLNTHLKSNGCSNCMSIERKRIRKEDKELKVATNKLNKQCQQIRDNLNSILSSPEFTFTLEDGIVHATHKCGATYKTSLERAPSVLSCTICKQQSTFINRFKVFKELAVDKYKGAYRYIAMTVKGDVFMTHSCGHTFWQDKSSHLYGNYGVGVGCPKCAKYGFSDSRDGWLYLLDNHTYLKIGITNREPTERVAQINKYLRLKTLQVKPFKLICKWKLHGNGRSLEKAIHQALFEEGIQQPTEIFDGYTECFITRDIDKVVRIVENFIK